MCCVLICVMEAKCCADDLVVGDREISKSISRIRYYQFDLLITTSYVHKAGI